MVLLKGLAAIFSIASIAISSPLDLEASPGALGVAPALGLPAIPAVAPLDHALEPGNLPHMPADLATGQLAPHSQKSENHNGQVATEKLGSHKGIEAGHNVHSHAKHQHFALGQNKLLPPTTEEKALAPPPPPKLSIREVIERGFSNIGARSDPPAQSFIQALGNMFSGLGKDKSKRDAPPALPAPPGSALGAMNVSSPPNSPDPAAGVLPLSQGNSPTPPTPALPAPAPVEAAVPPPAPQSGSGPAPQSGSGNPPPAGSPPPPTNPNSAPANPIALSPSSIGSHLSENPPAPPATPADAAAPSAVQAPPASNANPPSNLSAASSAINTGAFSSLLDSTAPHDFKPVPASPGVVAQDGHMGQFDPQSGLLGAQKRPAYRHGANIEWAHSMGSHLAGGPKNFGHRASHHRQHHQGMNHYGTHLSPTDYRMPQGVPFDFQASLMPGPPAGPSMTGSGQQLAVQSRYYRKRRNLDFTPLPRTRRSLHARNRVYFRRAESSTSAGPSDEPVEEKASASEATADDKPVKPDDTTDSTPAVKAETADSKPKEKPDTETAGKTVNSKVSDKSKDDTAEKAADSKASVKSKASTADEPADDKPASKSDAIETSTKSKAAAEAGKHMGSMPAGLDSSFAMGGAEDATPKKHKHHAVKAHKESGKSPHGAHGHSKAGKHRAKAPAYKARPKGPRRKSKGKKPSVSDHHSSRYNPHHKMIPQIARRHDLRARNAAAEADAWVDAHAKYLHERDVYAEYFAKREANAYPEAWACSDPSGCN
ncbi:hypothetical protein MMC27_004982 [Xylographa pallens]|nr:hypothetical protein [Xylographa pallens]